MTSQDFLALLGEQWFYNHLSANWNQVTISLFMHSFVLTQTVDHDTFGAWGDYFWNNTDYFSDAMGGQDQAKYDAFMAHQPA